MEFPKQLYFKLLDIPDEAGECYDITGSLDLLLVSEEVKGYFNNTEEKMKHLKEKTIAFLEECNLLEGMEEYRKKVAEASAACSICTLPKIKKDSDGAEWLSVYFATFFIYDDILEKRIANQCSLEEVIHISEWILKQMDSDREMKYVGNFPEGGKILGAVHKLRIKAKKSFKHFDKCLPRLLGEMRDYLLSNPWRRLMLENLDAHSFLSVFELRKCDGAVEMTMGGGAFVLGVNLSDDIYNSPLFMLFRTTLVRYLILSNDLFGLKRDITESNLNLVTVWETKRRISLLESLNDAVNTLDVLLRDFKMMKKDLRKIYKKEKDFLSWINSLNVMMYGFQTQYAKLASFRYSHGAEFSEDPNNNF